MIVSAAGLALYLWPALAGPPVLWSDSVLDLRWASEGVGISKPLSSADLGERHQVKPGYLLFLRGAGAALPFLPRERSIVVTQSVLLWGAIVGVAWMTARRRSAEAGTAVCLALLLFFPLRDAASNVMPEAISAAFFLTLALAAVEPPRTARGAALVGGLAAALFWIRPNVGGIATLVIVGAWSLARLWRRAAAFGAVMLIITASLWLATKAASGPDPSRGLRDPILAGSAEYGWGPSQGVPSGRGTGADTRMELARRNWRAVLEAAPPDRIRELRWRLIHGLLGLEYYDARWSAGYRALDHGGRLVAPWLVLAAVAAALAGSRESRGTAVAAILIIAGVVGQSVIVGAFPRFALPLIPGVILIGAVGLLGDPTRRSPGRAFIVFVLFAGLVALHPELTSWEWGQIERADVRIEQKIPRGALPRRAPATLHLRIGQPAPALAGYVVRVAGVELVRGPDPDAPKRSVVVAALSQAILDASANGDVILTVTSTGSFGPDAYLLFAVIPPPFGRGATRLPAGPLSPGSDVQSGALDWWAHAGLDPGQRAASASATTGKSVSVIRTNALSIAYIGPKADREKATQ
jgi:hypothetical protein